LQVFNSVWYLKQHAVKHSSERPFTCKYCHKRFIERHKDQLHRCSKCTMCFPSREYLARHNAWHVFEEEKVCCPHCSEKFDDDLSYGVHKQSHSPLTLHVCLRCRGRFCHRLALKRHLVKCCSLYPQPSYDPSQFIDRSPPPTPLSIFNEQDLSSVSSSGSSGFSQGFALVDDHTQTNANPEKYAKS
uniref:C2H2-type domain-containing protein n=1 Tax=Soboliphyme baturini TaxID=241478 RepID=A0A183J1H9_9BILA